MGCFYCDEHHEGREAIMFKVGEMKAGVLYLFKDQAHKGRCALALKDHKKELCECDPQELADFAQVQRDAMMLAQSAQESQGTGGDSLLELRRRLQELSVEQESLLEQILDNMDDVELNARLKEVADEKQKVKNKIESLRQNEIYQAEREERLQAMWASIQEHAKGFQAYDDELTRLVVEKITVLDSNTIRIRFRDTDLEMDRTL